MCLRQDMGIYGLRHLAEKQANENKIRIVLFWLQVQHKAHQNEAVEADQAVFDVFIRILFRVLDQVCQLIGDVGGES